MIIVGAGMGGLIAAAVLRNNCEKIIEAQTELPANHSAVLRFKSSIVGDTTNIPFKKVQAIKSYIPWRNKIADAMAYSAKVNGSYQLRSIITADGNVVERYVAPPNFTEQLAAAAHCPIIFGKEVTKDDLLVSSTPIISTLPMPLLMKLLDYDGPKPEFKSISGINVLARIKDCNMYCSLYVPNPNIGPYRISINGDLMIAEVALLSEELKESVRYGSLNNNDSIKRIVGVWREQALDALGVSVSQTFDHSFARQQFAKITPIDESMRQRFIIWASDTHNCFSLGRFATWRPGLLLDDIVNDIRIINRIIAHGNYEQRKMV